MTQDMNSTSNETQNEQDSDWKPLDLALRKMATLSQHEKDLENYEILRQELK